MATAISNPLGAYGYALTDDGGKVLTVLKKAATTITKGNLVALSSSVGYVIKCLTDTAQKLIIGVAYEDIPANDAGIIVTYGEVHGVLKDTSSAVTAGDVVTRAATDTAGVTPLAGTTAVTQYKDVGLGIGIVVANAAATATTCSVFVCKGA